MRTTLRAFIREHRAEIDAAINAALFRHDGRGGRGTIPAYVVVHNCPVTLRLEAEGKITRPEGG